MRFPYNEDGRSYGRGPNGERVCRGAMMGRDGADPRAKWPHGVLSLEDAWQAVAEAESQLRRFPHDAEWQRHHGATLAEARARLEAVEKPYRGRLTLRRVPLSDGYDGGGAYWGQRSLAKSLWCAWSPDRAIVIYVDAPGHRAAADLVREEYPEAHLYSHGEPLQ